MEPQSLGYQTEYREVSQTLEDLPSRTQERQKQRDRSSELVSPIIIYKDFDLVSSLIPSRLLVVG